MRFRVLTFAAIITCVLLPAMLSPAAAQSVRPANVETVLDDSFHSMYNLQFDEALRSVEYAKTLDKSDPLPWVAQVCAVLFREFDRLHIMRSEIFASDDAFNSRPAYSWISANKAQFEQAAAGGEKIARERLTRDKNDVKALFALSVITGMRGDASAMITKHNLDALGYWVG